MAVTLAISLALAALPSGEALAKAKTATKAQAVTELWKLCGSPKITGSIVFKDVKKTASYADAVRWAYRNAIIPKSDKFKPTAKITRQELALMLYNLSGTPEINSKWKGFSDQKKVGKNYDAACRWAKAKNVFKKIATKKLNPKKKVTKTQLAAIIKNYKSGVGKEPVQITYIPENFGATGIALDSDGYLYITDDFAKKVWRMGQGKTKAIAGADSVVDIYDTPMGGYADGTVDKALFKSPWAISPFMGGWAVSDPDANSIRLIKDGKVTTINGNTKEDLAMNKMGVIYGCPTGLTTDPGGNLYIADTDMGAIRVLSPEGNVTTLTSGLLEPMGLCYYDGYIYVAESGANRILRINISEKSNSVVAGTGTDSFVDGPASNAAFSHPQGVTVDENGVVYVADTVNSAIRKIKNGKVTTLFKRSEQLETWPSSPTGLCIYGSRLYVTDCFARKVYIIKK